MRRPLTALIAAACALTFTAPSAGARSPVEGAEKRQCFWTRNATSFAAEGDQRVNVRVGVRDVYQFELFGPCLDIDWSHKIALVSRASSTICTGLDAEIVTQGPIGEQRCPVRAVRKLTPVEIAALPKGAKP